ncbi:hypothetical protein COT97_01760 [Candidatus Falkowbacteria bacterium CG10_big_fil_rev_8_21_14_0_10_39_11]|uniref:Glycosyltransferase family 1 protein n=1 Tax=Candidatus Falkowbacteria bacterium CG10_big_fil_rev_8_21_14_0_10_39_11 TaxID=1974565 RepID=A0A2H0V5I2_9BACT|nr:MAG: hypothetical protein COT97_01760 [Candidatus Falkowbacteria bacterium CG10_big_fil_rev_8_21_14_0_10_39_11]
MKIAIDARMYGEEQTTGIGQYIKQLTNHLFKIDSENQYIMFMRSPEFDRYNPPAPNVKKVKVTPRWYTYGEQFKLPSEFKQEKFDLIHYPHFNSPIFYHPTSVCTIHDITPLFFPGHKMKSIIRRVGYKTVFKGTLKNASQIIAVSDSTKQGLIKHLNIPETKIKITHEGVDERFKIIENNGIINKVKERYKITRPFVFYVGVWRNHKNIESLISAFEMLKTKYDLPHQLVLAGQEDPSYPDIRLKIDSSPVKNDIITPGFVNNEDLPVLYNAAELLAFPSFIEGFGLIAIEAQNCGCPVAASNTTSLPEVLNNSALLFDPKNISDIADKIYQIISTPELQKQLKEKGLQNSQRFSWYTCAKQTLAVYNKILQKQL